jgi:hypothetical protein
LRRWRAPRPSQFRESVRGYEVVALVVGAGLAVTWPGLYAEPTWNQVMTNAFATFLVTPVLIFGVDRVLARAREVREHPRRKAIRAELGNALSITVNIGAVGTVQDLLPGLLDAISELMQVDGIDAVGEHTAFAVLERSDELRAAAEKLPPDQLLKLVAAVASQRQELRELLFEAGDSLSPELYADLLAAAQRVGKLKETERLLTFAITSPKGYDLDSPGGRGMRSIIARDFAAALATVAELYVDLRVGRP